MKCGNVTTLRNKEPGDEESAFFTREGHHCLMKKYQGRVSCTLSGQSQTGNTGNTARIFLAACGMNSRGTVLNVTSHFGTRNEQKDKLL